MDLRKLKTLIDLVSESNVSELEITEAEGKVRIVKAGVAAPIQYLQSVGSPLHGMGAAPAAAPIAPAAAPVRASTGPVTPTLAPTFAPRLAVGALAGGPQ